MVSGNSDRSVSKNSHQARPVLLRASKMEPERCSQDCSMQATAGLRKRCLGGSGGGNKSALGGFKRDQENTHIAPLKSFVLSFFEIKKTLTLKGK